MIGGHCIKAWAKTQAVIAKSSAESELYSVVKGATEGLGLITLYKDMGSEVGVKLNLDATAAKGILERQGIPRFGTSTSMYYGYKNNARRSWYHL